MKNHRLIVKVILKSVIAATMAMGLAVLIKEMLL